MKKQFSLLLSLTLLMGVLTTTALATDTEIAGPFSISHVAEISDDVAFLYTCETPTTVTVNEDVGWVLLSLYDDDYDLTSLGFCDTYGEDMPIFNCDNMKVVMEETNTTYTMETYLQGCTDGTIDFNEPSYIPAGSSFEILPADGFFILEAINVDMIPFNQCAIRTIPGDATPAEPETPAGLTAFSDVPAGASYEQAVVWAGEAGVTQGYADGTFRPEASCTRGQVVTFLHRALGCPKPTITENPFSDVSADSPYYDAILWAVGKGVTTGYADSTFRPNDTCTSAHIITFLHRSLGAPQGAATSPLSAGAATAFVPAINWADGIGLLDGMGFVAGSIAPRADIVTYLWKNSTMEVPAAPEVEESKPEVETAQTVQEEILDLVNECRAEAGCAPLKLEDTIQAAADIRVQEIEGTFSHTRPDGSSCFTAMNETGANYGNKGENIASGQRSPQEVMTAWINSPGHYANIVNPNYRVIGIGNDGYNWVQMFGG